MEHDEVLRLQTKTLYIPKEAAKDSHAQGMAQILRLRGPDLVHNSRGWSLFRLAHHRIVRDQTARSLMMLKVPSKNNSCRSTCFQFRKQQTG